MTPAFVGRGNFSALHIPISSLFSDIFLHERSDELYALIDCDPALLDAKDSGGRTCLYIVIESANFAAAEILLHAGADKNLPDHAGLTPLDFVDVVWSDIKKWRGGYSGHFKAIFDEMRRILKD
jgi:hypothetical protein